MTKIVHKTMTSNTGTTSLLVFSVIILLAAVILYAIAFADYENNNYGQTDVQLALSSYILYAIGGISFIILSIVLLNKITGRRMNKKQGESVAAFSTIGWFLVLIIPILIIVIAFGPVPGTMGTPIPVGA